LKPIQFFSTKHASQTLPPATVQALCSQSLFPPGIEGRTSKGLAWLRTNRQIYAEAHPLLANHLTLTIWEGLVLAAFITRSPKLSLDPSTLRHLALCVKRVNIESDLRDGFLISEDPRVNLGWTHSSPNCMCSHCFVLKGIGSARDKLPSLRKLSVVVNFMCKSGQGNERPVVGIFANGRPRKGQLYRPKYPPLLALKNSKEGLLAFVREFFKRMPLVFFQGMKLELVIVKIGGSITHNMRNVCPHPRDRCWCIGRSLDEGSLTGLKDEITKLLFCGGDGN
jgi:hypothetical protein